MELTTEDFQWLKSLEERLWMTKFRYDRAWFESVLAEDFFEFGQSGRVYSRDECLNIPESLIDVVIPLPDFNARFLSTEIVQITYRSIFKLEGEVASANRSSIWSRSANGWKLKFHQGTPIKN